MPGLAAGTLRELARWQGTECNEERDEEIGKILHERRDGEMAGNGEIPFGRYYGSIDATPLFILVLAEYRRTGDLALARTVAGGTRRIRLDRKGGRSRRLSRLRASDDGAGLKQPRLERFPRRYYARGRSACRSADPHSPKCKAMCTRRTAAWHASPVASSIRSRLRRGRYRRRVCRSVSTARVR